MLTLDSPTSESTAGESAGTGIPVARPPGGSWCFRQQPDVVTLWGSRRMLRQSLQHSWKRVQNGLSHTAQRRETLAAGVAVVLPAGRECRLGITELGRFARRTDARENASAKVRQCGLRHGYAYHYRIKRQSVDNYSRIRLVEHRMCVICANKRMKMYPVFLRSVAGPHKSGIGTPDLNPSRVLRLPNVDRAARRLRRAMR